MMPIDKSIELFFSRDSQSPSSVLRYNYVMCLYIHHQGKVACPFQIGVEYFPKVATYMPVDDI